MRMTHVRSRDSAARFAAADDGSHVVVATPRVEVPTTRVVFVDLLRLLAAFQMLQGHTVAALLAPAHRVGKLYALWSAARGLTSVAFLFAAGLAFYVTTARDYAAHRQSPPAVQRRVRRGVRLIVLGYVLHAPLLAWWSGDAQLAQSALQRFPAVDVLQCMGVGLLCLECLVLLAPTPQRLAWTAFVIGAALLACGQLLAHVAAGPLPDWFEAYFLSSTGSLFPWVPWSAHMFLGVASAAFVLRDASRSAERLSLLAAGALLVGGTLRAANVWHLFSDHASRLGWVALTCSALVLASKYADRLPRWLLALAGETLFLYVFHVLLVYGDSVGLAQRVGPSLSPGAAVAAALAVVALSFGSALVYRRLFGGSVPKRVRVERLAGAAQTR
jgi:hypothetical protein